MWWVLSPGRQGFLEVIRSQEQSIMDGIYEAYKRDSEDSQMLFP